MGSRRFDNPTATSPVTPTRGCRHQPRRVAGRAKNVAASLFLTAICAAACSREVSHQVLVFFYDGVPPLNAVSQEQVAETQDGAPPSPTEADERLDRARESRKYYNHPRYWENSCGSCHDAGGRLVKTVRHGLCVTCHFVKPEDKKKYIHGPVAVNGCLACHRYHRSRYPKILLTDAQTLCANCHEAATLTKDKHHATMETERCVDCHDPHGGDDRFFLLPGVAMDNSSGNAPTIEREQ